MKAIKLYRVEDETRFVVYNNEKGFLEIEDIWETKDHIDDVWFDILELYPNLAHVLIGDEFVPVDALDIRTAAEADFYSRED